ncbi:MAG: ribosomal-protein-alanine N-acetyltransferase [Gemmatimonadales bacterium]|nr:MAG: ribosomal-protein-alanine N-acetyltransferase [Gemmatimonadales bacterium]
MFELRRRSAGLAMSDVPTNRPGPVLRVMRESDLRDVLHIERRSFSIPWQESTFRGLMRRASASLLVAEEGGVVVGFAVMWFAADEAELGDLSVHPEARRRGLGGWILKGAMREAGRRGAAQVFLEVREANTDARRLYEKAGFVNVGVRPSYYTEPVEDAILMRCSLDTSEG